MSELWSEIILPGEYDLDVAATSASGTRTFVRDDGGGGIATEALPVVGVSLMRDHIEDADVPGCFCRNVKKGYVLGTEGTPKLVFTYSTADNSGADSPGSQVPLDADARSFEAGAELDSFTPNPKQADGDYWTVDGAAESVIEEALPRSIFRGRFSLPAAIEVPGATEEDPPTYVSELTAAQKNTFLARVIAAAGTINNAAFEGFAAGQVKFTNISGGSSRNSDGELRFFFEMHFEFRVIGENLDGTAIANDDWLYILSSQYGKYIKPKTNVSAKYLYKKTDFAALTAPFA